MDTSSYRVVGYDSGFCDIGLPIELLIDPVLDKVVVKFKDFSNIAGIFNSVEDKLSYALTMTALTESYNITSADNFYKSNGFKDINDAVKYKYHCGGVYIDSDINIHEYTYIVPGTAGIVEKASCIKIPGYISPKYAHDKYKSLKEFLDDYNVDLYNFLFNPGWHLIFRGD